MCRYSFGIFMMKVFKRKPFSFSADVLFMTSLIAVGVWILVVSSRTILQTARTRMGLYYSFVLGVLFFMLEVMSTAGIAK